ncbi:hypothetical protein pdam_00002226, partial [Pocillopora damicornis]
SLKFFHVSDVHLDPFYNKAADVSTYCQGSGLTADYEAPYGRIGCDSPLALWKIALLGMKEEGQSAEFMMLSGDSSAHGLTDDHGSPKVLKAMSMVASEAHKTFQFFLQLATMTSLDIIFYQTIAIGGKMILLVLNTMYWNNNWYTNDLVKQIAETQMQWFKDQLQLAKDQKKRVLIMSHIPPGGDPHDGSYFWHKQYLIPYASLTAGQFHDVVAGQFYGHTHRNDFHLQIMNTASDEAEKTSTKSFVLQVASVSPVYSNNPTFRVMSLDTRERALVDYDQYYLDLVLVTEFAHPVWKFDSTFSRKYPSKHKLINADRIDELNRKLISQTEGRY